MANIILHGIGGAGINIAVNAFKLHGGLYKHGYSKLVTNFLDTSDANIAPINDIGQKLHRVVSTKTSVDEISGSGSERATNVEDAKVSVKKYLDDVNVTKDNPSDIHVVIFSGSGGSGSSVGLLLLRELLLKECAVVALVVGDNDNLLYTINTTKTLESLASISKMMNNITTVYYINNSFYKGELVDRLDAANKVASGFIYSLLLITADSNKELDKADVRALFKQSSFRTINIPQGISFIEDYSKNIDEPQDNSSITLVRTITADLSNVPKPTDALHTKVGVILNENIREDAIKYLPISLVTKSGCLDGFLNFQNNKIAFFKEIEANLSKDTFEAKHFDDESGLVF